MNARTSPLTPADRKYERYRRSLQQKAEELRRGLSAQRAAEIVHRPDEPLDFGDWCQKSHEEWLFLNQNRMEMKLLRDIEAGLHRLDDGTYGVCQNCGEPIAVKRLDAVPWARFCVPCEESLTEAA